MKDLVIELKNRALTGKIYESWSELSPAQIIHILTVMYAQYPHNWGLKIVVNYQNMQILKALNDWSDEDLQEWRHAVMIEEMTKNENIDIYMALDIWYEDLKNTLNSTIAFAITENTEVDTRTINQTLYRNPIPWFKLKEKSGAIVKWYAAYCDEDEPFRDMKLHELGHIFTLYEQYRENNDDQVFNEILAVIYRPGKNRTDRQNDDNDDPRQELEQSNKKLRIRIAMVREQIPGILKRTIELHLTSAMARFAEMYPTVFNGKKSNTQKGDFLDFVLELSDYDPTKSDILFKRSAHDMFELAERMIIRSKKLIEESK